MGVGRFRILGGGGQRLEYWGGGGQISKQAHDVVMTWMRRKDVASTSFRRHVPTRFLINQCHIIALLILKSYIIQNSRIELTGIVLPVPSNQIKITFIIILPFSLVHLCLFQFLIELEGQCRWIIWGGAQWGCCPPPFSNYWGAWPPPPLPPPPLFPCRYGYILRHV